MHQTAQPEDVQREWKQRRTELVDLWRRAMDGETEALARLGACVNGFHLATNEGRAVRRMAARAYVKEAKRLAALAEKSANADELRQARAYASLAFVCRLADHPLLRGQSRATSAPRNPFGPEVAVLDPPPDAPTDVIATNPGGLGATSATVAWTVPDPHGLPITNYLITPLPVGAPATVPPGTSATVPALLNGTTYTFIVQAINTDGTSLPSLASNPVTIGTAPPGASGAPSLAVAGTLLTATWTAPAGGPYSYLVTLQDGAGAPISGYVRSIASGAPLKAAFLGMAPGDYRFGVRAIGVGGYGNGAQSAVATIVAGALTNFHPPTFHPYSSDSVLNFALGGIPIDPAVVKKRLAIATSQGSKWRYEYLRTLATRAANDAQRYDSYVAQLMQLAVAKVSTAELLAGPALHGAITQIEGNTQSINSLATSADVLDVVQRLADAASTALLLEAIVLWLIEYDPIDFWIGLFNKIIDDISAFDGNLPRTKNYLDAQFAIATVGTIGDAVRKAAAQMKTRADREIERLAGPLRAAVAQLIAETNAAMKDVFQSIDVPLLMTPAGAGMPDVPNVNPLTSVLGALSDAVESLIQKIKSDVQAALDQVIAALGTSFRRFMIIYVCVPILAFLVISVAGGPFSAAALAAIVLVAAQKLIQLLARWLAGPILDKVENAKRRVTDALEELEGIFQRTIASFANPEPHLKLLASQLLELKNLLPQAFLYDLAELAGEARRAVLATANELALAAERAAGFENGTAFLTIATSYESGVTPAPQMPGGTDPTIMGGAAVLRDLNRLDLARLRIRDPKEVVLNHRLSLYRLLGGTGDPATAVPPASGGLDRLLSGGQVLVRLSEESLLDAGFPGLYRAMISDVRVTGVFRAATAANAALPQGVGLTLTHLGESRMRVRRDANPAAPPLVLSECLPPTAAEFIQQVLTATTLAAVVNAIAAAAIARVRPQDLAWWWLEGPDSRQQIREYLLDRLPPAIANAITPVACGAADEAAIRNALLNAMPGWPWWQIPVCEVHWHFFFPHKHCPSVSGMTTGFNNMNPTQLVTNALQQALTDMYNNAIIAQKASIARWGIAGVEEDRDPQVRALGFMTLVQSFDPETAVYNLLPDGSPIGAVGRFSEPAPAPPGQDPATAIGTHQYRPFENRGLQGDFLFTIQNTTRASSLLDLVLDITIRACYDDDLAATVRSSRAQNADHLALVNAVAAAMNRNVVFPGMLPDLGTRVTNIRTIHFSARAQRDKLLRAAIAAGEAAGIASPVDGLAFNAALLPLRTNNPLSNVGGAALQTVVLQIQKDPPTSLGSLHGVIPVTPDDIGIPASLLTSSVGRIVSLGYAVIPTQPGVVANMQLAAAPTIDATLAPLLPQVANPGFNLGDRLVTTTLTVGAPVLWRDVWNAATPKLTLDFGPAITNGHVWDVIFSLSVEVPVASVEATPGAVF
jgi:hypothetical protein